MGTSRMLLQPFWPMQQQLGHEFSQVLSSRTAYIGSIYKTSPMILALMDKSLAGCTAETIATVEQSGSKRPKAAGVYVHPNGRQDLVIFVRAPLVLACGGALHTPALLLRSGIGCGGNVGKHLHLHCGAVVAARFPRKARLPPRHHTRGTSRFPLIHLEMQAQDLKNEGRIKLWEGPVMSTYSRELADWSGKGYGPLVSMTSVRL